LANSGAATALDSEGTAVRRLSLRFGVSVVTLVVFSLLVVLMIADNRLYLTILNNTVAITDPVPLGDLGDTILAATCWHAGVDVYAPNGCMGGGVYNYSPFMLRMAYLPIGQADVLPIGLVIDIGYISALSLLPLARSWSDLACRCLAAISTSTAFALESANIDAGIFLLTILGFVLCLRGSLSRSAAFLIFALLAAIKFYPAVLFTLALRERLRVLLAFGIVAILLIGLFLFAYADDTRTAYDILPSGLPFDWLFGAINLPFGIMLLAYMPHVSLTPTLADYQAAITHPYASLIVSGGIKLFGIVAFVVALALRRPYRAVYLALTDAETVFLVGGAITFVGCFFIAQNLDHRAIFLILTLPAIATMSATTQGRSKILLQCLIGALLFLLSESVFRLAIGHLADWLLPQTLAVYPKIMFFLVRELLWWGVTSQMLAFLLLFIEQNSARLVKEGSAFFVNKRRKKLYDPGSGAR